MLTILLWLPLAAVLAGAVFPRRYVGWPALLGALGALGLAIALVVDYTGSEPGLIHVVDRTWISQLGIHYKLGVDGLNVFLILLAAILWVAAVLAAGFQEGGRPRAVFFWGGPGGTAGPGALLSPGPPLVGALFDPVLIPV